MTNADGRSQLVGPLHGTRVLDLTSVIMGPLATQILGDLGADVIVVESAQGDTNRDMSAGPHADLSGQSMNLLRNKRNIVLDLKTAGGREACLRIAATVDVVITNLRPGPLRRLRLTYDDVQAVNPKVVFCQAAGFASTSERAEEPAYDDIIQAASGVADAYRRVSGRPGLAPTIFADKVCGLTIVYAVMAALLHRERTGEGQQVEVPMNDVMTAFMLVEHASGATFVPPTGPVGYQRILTPNRRPQPTADGWINIMAYEREHFDELFRAGGHHDLVGDERSATRPARIGNADFLYSVLHTVTPSRTTVAWLAFCRERGIPATAVADLDDLVAALPEAEHPHAGTYRQIPPPVRFASTPASVRRPAPLIGEHSREVLLEIGYSPAEVDALERSGAAGRQAGEESGSAVV